MTRRVWSVTGVAVALVALGGVAPTTARSASSGYVLIVSSANPTSGIARAELAGCYLGERRQWPDGQPVVVVDQSAKSTVRAVFSQEVLGRSVDAVQTHWMKLIMAGRGRPPLTASEEDVVNMVAKEKRMVGYVSVDAVLPPEVKAVPIRD